MDQTKPRRIQRPIVCAGAPISQRKLASASLPARVSGPVPVAFEMGQQKEAYSAVFVTALKYGPEEAAEALSMVLAACIRTLGKRDLRTALMDTRTGKRMVLEARLVVEGEEPGPEPRSKRRSRK